MATIKAARLHFPGRRLIVVFRPHTYSRTLSLRTEYLASFAGADIAYVTDIEGAREAHLEATVSGRDIVDGAKGDVHYAPDRKQLADVLVERSQPGDVILSMSVGTYDNLVQELDRRINH